MSEPLVIPGQKRRTLLFRVLVVAGMVVLLGAGSFVVFFAYHAFMAIEVGKPNAYAMQSAGQYLSNTCGPTPDHCRGVGKSCGIRAKLQA